GSDRTQRLISVLLANFNPRSQYRERPYKDFFDYEKALFQSTLPIQGATVFDEIKSRCSGISIHAPNTGSDITFSMIGLPYAISIHAPNTGSDHLRPRFHPLLRY